MGCSQKLLTFVHLHVHSSFSKMQGTNSPTEIFAATRNNWMDTIALTDTNGLYGLILAIQQAREYGVRLIVGSELVTNEHRALCLVKDGRGYENLCRLISERHCRKDFNLCETLPKYSTGLIIITDDEQVLKQIRKEKKRDLYVELSPGYLMHQAYSFSMKSGIPPVATNRVYFTRPHYYPLHKLLRAIDQNTKLSRIRPEDTCLESNYLKSPKDMIDFFPHAPHAIENTIKIARECKTDWEFGKIIFPSFKGLTNEEAFKYLTDETLAGAKRRYGKLSTAVLDRIDYELCIIRDKDYAHYFLVVQDIVKQSPRTCGRGSAAASIVSYCLGITHVDPIRHNLFFERFLNPGRRDPPDIDVDFAWDERDRILDYVFQKYGAKKTAMVANQVGFKLRGAIREIQKLEGVVDGTIDKKVLEQAKLLPGLFRNISLHCGGVVIVPDDIRKYVPTELTPKGIPVIQWEKDQAEDAGLVKIDLLGNRSIAVIRDGLKTIQKNYGGFIGKDLVTSVKSV